MTKTRLKWAGATLITGLFMANTTELQAQALSAGDIAIIGVNSDLNTVVPADPDELALVALKTIPSGTRIYISDYFWDANNSRWGNDGNNGTTINASEGVITWTTTTSIAAGTVFKVGIAVSGGLTTITGLPGTVSATGWSLPAIAQGGDNWFIYQGANAGTPSTWIFGFANWAAPSSPTYTWLPLTTTAATAAGSHLPVGLTNGVNAIALTGVTSSVPTPSNPHYDNMVYNGVRTGSKSVLLGEIVATGNWLGDETTTYNLSPGGTQFPGANPVFTIAAPLPVSLSSFTATPLNNAVVLNWITATEKNNAGFEVERSTDGKEWTALDFVKGMGASTQSTPYAYTDISPLKGQNLYRLNQKDFDGKQEYSKVVKVQMEWSATPVYVYPNPGKEAIHIRLNDLSLLHSEVSLYTSYGEQIKNMTLSAAQTKLDISNLSAGTYLLKFADGTVHKVIKD
ncbi:hypothetical protein DBR32_07670 [Taibaiella sp. KBW10]|uniref:T9SS type A sorting domain-containing protein n=1 Tax=Taibaiella sp. KBW10 TaxID=2153357 RepID=UPI000F5AA056|nr:T9SS type A sorting domain-containing protein [Taibaiella sp. KBW10]RQO31810.1 hypothetical protein DBR32_07670 [Taibaiella sp. KBW10]